MTTAIGLGTWALIYAQDERHPRPPVRNTPPAFSKELDTVENAALVEQMRKDLRRLSVRDVNLFHRRLVRTLRPRLPENVRFRNQGPVAQQTGGRQGIVRETDDLTGALSWMVEGTVGIFGFWVSTKRTNTTVAVCDIEGTRLFLNVDFVNENRSVDEKLPELGGRSVRETLRLLEGAAPKEQESQDSSSQPADCGEATEQDRQRSSDFSDFKKLIELIQQENEDRDGDGQRLAE